MTTEEYLLTCLGEECAEIQKEISKALRFGLDHNWPDGDPTNRSKICIELADLAATRQMLEEEGTLPPLPDIEERIAAKKTKILKHMAYSIGLRRIELE